MSGKCWRAMYNAIRLRSVASGERYAKNKVIKMSKIRCSFEMEIDINFQDTDKAKSYYIDGDWKESFYSLADLEEVAEQLSYSFYVEDEKWDKILKAVIKFVEGFGTFVKKDNEWHLTEEFASDGGGIIICYETSLTVANVVGV